MSAPRATIASTSGTSHARAATCSGVSPFSANTAFGSAPCSSNHITPSGMRLQWRIAYSDVAPSVAHAQRRVEIRVRDPRVQCEHPLGAIVAAVRRRFEELVQRGVELERDRFNVVVQRVPGGETVLACDHGLRIVQGMRLARLEKLLRLAFELVEIWTWGELLGSHKASMLNAGGPQAGQQGDNRAMIRSVGWTQSFARTRVRPERVGTMASGGLVVKRRAARTSPPGAPVPAAPPPRTR